MRDKTYHILSLMPITIILVIFGLWASVTKTNIQISDLEIIHSKLKGDIELGSNDINFYIEGRDEKFFIGWQTIDKLKERGVFQALNSKLVDDAKIVIGVTKSDLQNISWRRRAKVISLTINDTVFFDFQESKLIAIEQSTISNKYFWIPLILALVYFLLEFYLPNVLFLYKRKKKMTDVPKIDIVTISDFTIGEYTLKCDLDRNEITIYDNLGPKVIVDVKNRVIKYRKIFLTLEVITTELL